MLCHCGKEVPANSVGLGTSPGALVVALIPGEEKKWFYGSCPGAAMAVWEGLSCLLNLSCPNKSTMSREVPYKCILVQLRFTVPFRWEGLKHAGWGVCSDGGQGSGSVLNILNVGMSKFLGSEVYGHH